MLQMDQLPHLYPSQCRSASAIQNNDGFAAGICRTAKRRDIFGLDLALEADQIEVSSGFPAYLSADSGVARRQEQQDDPDSPNRTMQRHLHTLVTRYSKPNGLQVRRLALWSGVPGPGSSKAIAKAQKARSAP
jgi:hypothetical protein